MSLKRCDTAGECKVPIFRVILQIEKCLTGAEAEEKRQGHS